MEIYRGRATGNEFKTWIDFSTDRNVLNELIFIRENDGKELLFKNFSEDTVVVKDVYKCRGYSQIHFWIYDFQFKQYVGVKSFNDRLDDPIDICLGMSHGFKELLEETEFVDLLIENSIYLSKKSKLQTFSMINFRDRLYSNSYELIKEWIDSYFPIGNYTNNYNSCIDIIDDIILLLKQPINIDNILSEKEVNLLFKYVKQLDEIQAKICSLKPGELGRLKTEENLRAQYEFVETNNLKSLLDIENFLKGVSRSLLIARLLDNIQTSELLNDLSRVYRQNNQFKWVRWFKIIRRIIDNIEVIISNTELVNSIVEALEKE